MPIKTESDGLFETTRRVIPCHGDPQTIAAEFQKWAEEMNAARPWEKTFDDNFLDAFEAEGKRFAALEPHQMTVDDEQLRQWIIRDAREVLRLVEIVRHARERGDIDAALRETVRLTRTHYRMTLRGAAPRVRAGGPIVTAHQARRVKGNIPARVAELVNEGMGKTRAVEQTADDFGVDDSTVWRRLREKGAGTS